jgi:hypothetical protein
VKLFKGYLEVADGDDLLDESIKESKFDEIFQKDT